jgi:hypothetical protein
VESSASVRGFLDEGLKGAAEIDTVNQVNSFRGSRLSEGFFVGLTMWSMPSFLVFR